MPRSRPKPPEIKDFQTPGVVFQPKTRKGMQKGINLLANAIGPTLGPLSRTVLNEKIGQRDKKPEVLDSGGTIARRIIQILGREADMGAMFLRHVLWSLQDSVGDGTAAAAMVFQTIYNQGVRYTVSGGNAMRVRHYMEQLIPPIFAEIDGMTVRVFGKEKLAGLAYTISGDADLSKLMGEIFDVIGEYGRLEIRSGRSRELEREYVEGIYWDTGLYSREMINDLAEVRAQIEDPAVLATDMDIQNPEDLIPLLDLAVKNGIQKLLLTAAGISDRALSVLLSKPNREKVEVVAVKAPGVALDVRTAAARDIALLTGGMPLLDAAGEKITSVRLENLGKARRAWARTDFFGIVGGKGNPRVLREHIAGLRATYNRATDKDDRKKLLERISKLMGGTATLWVGDISPIAIESRKELAERTAEAMRGAMREGVVPGGGVALLNCRGLVRRALQNASDPDEVAACRILLKALEAPTRRLLVNAGCDEYELMPEINKAGAGCGYDVMGRKIVDMMEAGIVDSAATVKASVRSGIAGVCLALTSDVLIHRKRPPESFDTA